LLFSLLLATPVDDAVLQALGEAVPEDSLQQCRIDLLKLNSPQSFASLINFLLHIFCCNQHTNVVLSCKFGICLLGFHIGVSTPCKGLKKSTYNFFRIFP